MGLFLQQPIWTRTGIFSETYRNMLIFDYFNLILINTWKCGLTNHLDNSLKWRTYFWSILNRLYFTNYYRCVSMITTTRLKRSCLFQDSLVTLTAAPQPAPPSVLTGHTTITTFFSLKTWKKIQTTLMLNLNMSYLLFQRYLLRVLCSNKVTTLPDQNSVIICILQEEKGVQCWRGVGVRWNCWMLSRTLWSCIRCRSLLGKWKVTLWIFHKYCCRLLDFSWAM